MNSQVRRNRCEHVRTLALNGVRRDRAVTLHDGGQKSRAQDSYSFTYGTFSSAASMLHGNVKVEPGK